MGFLVWLIGFVTKLTSKSKIAGKLRDKVDSKSKLFKKEKEKLKEAEKEGNGKSLKSKIAMYLGTLLLLFELAMLYALLQVVVFIVFVLIIVTVVIVIVMTMLNFFTSLIEPVTPPTDTEATQNSQSQSGGSGGKLEWSESQLAANMALLTPKEQNIYRLGILVKKSLDGYGNGRPKIKGGTLELRYADNDDEFMHKFFLGIASVETGMSFYENSTRQDNILVVPSDKSPNSAGYGTLGLNKNNTLAAETEQGVIDRLLKEYPRPAGLGREIDYYPWGVTMSISHLTGKWSLSKTFQKNMGKVDEIIDSWGIVKGKEEVKMFINGFTTLAQYHGAYQSHYEAYINFWCALYVYSGDSDETRSFSNYGLYYDPQKTSGIDYTESSFRRAFMGAGGKNGFHNVTNAKDLAATSSNTVITLNGQKLTKPVWALLGEKYGNTDGFKVTWAFAQERSSKNSDHTLNFHYGFNSYLQSERIYKLLQEKLPSTDSATGFDGNAGESNYIMPDGQKAVDYLENWIATSSSSSSIKNHIRSLIPMFGASSYLSNPDAPAKKAGYVDKKYGVPFYGQGESHKEVYRSVKWHPDAPRSPKGKIPTFSVSGCMVFANAYVMSALEGKLINPAELSAVMITKGALVSGGIVQDKMRQMFKEKGYTTEYYGTAVSNWKRMKDVVEDGALIVFRVKPDAGGGNTFTGSNHFMVINGIERRSGGDIIYIYDPVRPAYSMQAWNESIFINKTLHSYAYAVWDSKKVQIRSR